MVLMIAGLIGIAIEAPFFCVFFEFGEKLVRWSEGRKPWHKVIIYIGNCSKITTK